MVVDLVVFGVALIVILVGAELFTNGIEWFGHKLQLAEGAVGSVLAAVGTALPETLIPIVAIGFGAGGAAHEIGVGAILGAPFMLATLAMAVTATAVLVRGRRTPAGDAMSVDAPVLGTDLRYFFVAYAIALAAALTPPELGVLRWVAIAVLLGIYALYVRAHLVGDPNIEAADLAPLRLHRLDLGRHRVESGHPRMRIVSVQVAAALAAIVLGAVLFVDAVGRFATTLGVAPVLLSLVIAPIATELPEKANSIIWVRQGKDTLAMGNITGAMVFQSCIPVTVAIVFAPAAWHLNAGSALAFASALIAFASTATIFWPLVRRGGVRGRRLLAGGGFYLAYLALVGWSLAGA